MVSTFEFLLLVFSLSPENSKQGSRDFDLVALLLTGYSISITSGSLALA